MRHNMLLYMRMLGNVHLSTNRCLNRLRLNCSTVMKCDFFRMNRKSIQKQCSFIISSKITKSCQMVSAWFDILIVYNICTQHPAIQCIPAKQSTMQNEIKTKLDQKLKLVESRSHHCNFDRLSTDKRLFWIHNVWSIEELREMNALVCCYFSVVYFSLYFSFSSF